MDQSPTLPASTTAPAAPAMDADQFVERARAIEAEIGQVIVGQEDIVAPGAHLPARRRARPARGRAGPGQDAARPHARRRRRLLASSAIQFTPDLMPADITGTNIIVEEGGGRVFRFQQGPIFANLVLADEINRATPKTQSALLEAMQEHQVTVAAHALSARRAVLRAGHAEPDRDGGHLPAARGPARPLHVQGPGAVPDRGRAGRHPGADDRVRPAGGIRWPPPPTTCWPCSTWSARCRSRRT